MRFKKFYEEWSESKLFTESIVVPEIEKALKDWKNNTNSKYVIIGGIAVSFWTRPRTTMDIDILFKNDAAIPKSVELFKRHRKHSFESKKYGVEIEILSPEFLKIPNGIWESLWDTSRIKEGFRIASPSGLVALKAFRIHANKTNISKNEKASQDIADIISLNSRHDIDLSQFPLPKEVIKTVEEILNN